MTNKTPIQVQTTPRFRQVLKKLYKKYIHVADDLKTLLELFAEGETPGDQIPDIGYSVYKVRLSNRDAQRGKSGGYRVIYYLKTRQRVILIDIYSKSDQVDISADKIRRLIADTSDEN